MKKLTVALITILCSNYLFADPSDMAHDILSDIIHGPINSNPDLTEDEATQTVIVSLRGAMITLACANKTKKRSDLAKCVNNLKPRFFTIGYISESSFVAGQNAAVTQAGIHFEVKANAYPDVIQYLQAYDNNLTKTLDQPVRVLSPQEVQ